MVVQYKGEGPTSQLRQADVINKRLDGLIRKMDDPNLSAKDRMKLDREFDLLQRNFDKVMGLKKAGGKVSKTGMKIGGLTGNIQLKRNESDFTVRERSRRNLNKKFQEKKNKLREKYKDRGTAGAKQYRKESSEAEKKSQKKYDVDRAMVRKYGKDAYKSRAFGVSPEEPKRKKKPVPLNQKLMKEKGFSKGTADAIKGGDDYVKSVNFKVARSKLLRKIAKDKDKKKVTPKKTKTTAMRGGGLARSGAASLSGYKVR